MEKRIIYSSQPFGFDNAMLAGILSQARRNNPRRGITGALICRRDIYLQLIEGAALAIDDLFEQIRVDDRHTNVRLLLQDTVSERMFAGWSMVDDEAPSQFWSSAQIDAGVLDTVSQPDLLAPFERLKSRIEAA